MQFCIYHIVVLLILFSCQNTNSEKDELQENIKSVTVEKIYIDLPINVNFKTDFENSIKRADYRFVGTMGYSLEVPGVPNYYRGNYDKSNGVKIIKGTTDSFSFKEPEKMNNSIFYDNYAKSYNELLLKYLSKNIVK